MGCCILKQFSWKKTQQGKMKPADILENTIRLIILLHESNINSPPVNTEVITVLSSPMRKG